MNIKSEEAHRLAREVAELSGETLTEAVTRALRERHERLRARPAQVRARADALLALGRDTAARLDRDARRLDHGEVLYDEQGLPQ